MTPRLYPKTFPRRIKPAVVEFSRGCHPSKIRLPTEQSTQLTVGLAHAVLWELKARERDTYNSARVLGLPEECAIRLLEGAVEYEAMGGYTLATLRPKEGFFAGAEQRPSTTRLSKERSRLEKGLKIWDAKLANCDAKDQTVIRRGLAVRLKASQDVQDLWIFEHQDDLEAFIAMLEVLGIERKCLRITLEGLCVTKEERERHLESLKRLKITPALNPKATRPSRVTVSLKRSSSEFSYQGTVDRGLETLHIALLAGVLEYSGAPAPGAPSAAYTWSVRSSFTATKEAD